MQMSLCEVFVDCVRECLGFYYSTREDGVRMLEKTMPHEDAVKNTYRFETIRDKYRTIQEVQQGLREAGLESSNLIIGIDFTKSNTWTGKTSFQGRCLHDIAGPPNPYQQAMEIIGRTLEPFDDDRFIPVFGFGDSYTTDKSCFPFYPDRTCKGLDAVLSRYKEIVPGKKDKVQCRMPNKSLQA